MINETNDKKMKNRVNAIYLVRHGTTSNNKEAVFSYFLIQKKFLSFRTTNLK